ncbi:MAG: MBL fold metallo-hydrolase [Pseudomonadales bacterium]
MLSACGEGSDIRKKAELKAVEIIGNAATDRMPDDVAGGFHKIPIAVKELAEDVYQVQGIGNTHLINTSEGSVLFDTGLALQSAQQIAELKPYVTAPITHIIVSHSHADHIGGVRFWKEESTEIIAHREYAEEQRYLTELEPYLHQRNRMVFPWLPETLPNIPMIKYGGVEPSILVDEDDYEFVLGGVTFQVLSTPGAEGADNISLWLPDKKILFTGDTLGPNFPQFPNVFTMRGEKVRKPMEYIKSLDKMIALEPEMLVMSHHDHFSGKEQIVDGLSTIREATQYVHDAVVDGMNTGKTVYELMEEIKLPEHLQLTQVHGKVSWAVRSIWEYYATWFHFDTPTDLYPVPARDVYAELAELAGTDALIDKASKAVDGGELIKALHFLEVALAAEPDNERALRAQIGVYEKLLHHATHVVENNYEKDYMRALIKNVKSKLGEEQ